MDVEQLIAKGYELLTVFGVKILAALAVFIIGRWVVKYVRRLILRIMEKREVDPTLTKFVTNLIYFALLTFVIVAALGMLGIQTTSFIAVLGAAGLAVGLALQGSLSNFAAGVLMIVFGLMEAQVAVLMVTAVALGFFGQGGFTYSYISFYGQEMKLGKELLPVRI